MEYRITARNKQSVPLMSILLFDSALSESDIPVSSFVLQTLDTFGIAAEIPRILPQALAWDQETLVD